MVLVRIPHFINHKVALTEGIEAGDSSKHVPEMTDRGRGMMTQFNEKLESFVRGYRPPNSTSKIPEFAPAVISRADADPRALATVDYFQKLRPGIKIYDTFDSDVVPPQIFQDHPGKITPVVIFCTTNLMVDLLHEKGRIEQMVYPPLMSCTMIDLFENSLDDVVHCVANTALVPDVAWWHNWD